MPKNLDLPGHYRQQLLTLLEAHVPEAEVWAYGSRVNGTNHEGSDLDLVLRGTDLQEIGTEYSELLESVEVSTIPILVDIFDWARLPESFHREIERKYVVLKEARPWRDPDLLDQYSQPATIDLNPSHRKTVLRLLRGYVPGCDVRAYGPRVEWTAAQHAHLDLAILGASNVGPYALSDLRAAFQRSYLPFNVNATDWATMPNEMRQQINQRHFVLQSYAPSDEWTKTTLGQFAPLSYGKSLPARRRVADGRVLVYGSNGVVGKHDVPLTDGPTVIVGRKGSVGTVHYSKRPCWPIDTTYFVQDADSALTRFKYYMLSTLGLEQMNTDSAVPGLNRDTAHAREIHLPSKSDQRQIATILGALDDRIELNRWMCETLEEMAQALFKSWFVEFDPVRAKMEGCWRAGESLPGLPAHLYDLFPDYLAESELGPVPANWRTETLDEVADHLRDTIDPSRAPEREYALYSIPAFDSGKNPQIAQGGTIRSNKCVVKPETVLLSRLNPGIERTWFVGKEVGELAIASTEFAVLCPKPPIDLSFLYCSLRSDHFRNTLVGLVTGTSKSHQRVRPQALATMNILVPSEKILADFSSIASPWFDQILTLRRASERLTALRDTMLPKLISGEVRLPTVEERVGC